MLKNTVLLRLTIVNKIYIYGAGLLVLWFLYSQFIELTEDKAQQETEISNLRNATDILGKELVLRGKLNTKLNKDKVDIENKRKALQNDLTKLKTTPQQATCDVTATPVGYADRLLNREYSNKENVP